MIIDDLRTLGLNKNEAITYSTLQGTGKITAGELITKTGLHRNLVYQALEALGKKHLATKSNAGGAALFQATDPSHLLDHVREQELVAERAIEEMQQRTKVAGQEITIYEGAEGIRAYNLHNASALKKGDCIYVIGTGGQRLEQAMGMPAIKKYFSLIEKNGAIKVLAYPTQQYTENMYALIKNKPMFTFRLLPTNLAPAAGVIFTKHSVGFIIYEGAPAVIEVRNPHLVQAYQHYFDLLWNGQTAVPLKID